MNASSKQPAPRRTIDDWLTNAASRLDEDGIASARLDAELILAHALSVSRTWLVAHADDELEDPTRRHQANSMLTKRLQRMPLAYLTGQKEFYGRSFGVTPDVLVPRPETEVVVDKLLRLNLPESPSIHDVGTGSGCIAITTSLELPTSRVSASDISLSALEIAKANAASLGTKVDFHEADLLDLPVGNFDVIVANLPYVDESWSRSPETDHEPSLALFAEDGGLALIKELIGQSVAKLNHGGYLLLEADPVQHDSIIKTGAFHGLRSVESDDYAVTLQRG